jgi:hypothetical protein
MTAWLLAAVSVIVAVQAAVIIYLVSRCDCGDDWGS